MRHRITLFVFLCLAQVAALAQWIPTDTTELRRYMDNYTRKMDAMGDMVQRATLFAYRNSTDPTPADVGHSNMWKRGEHMRAEHLGVTTIQDASMRVVVDPEDRMIHVSRPDRSAEIQGSELRGVMFQAIRSIRKRESSDGTHFQLIFPVTAQYGTIEVVFDQQGWLRGITTIWGQAIPADPGEPLSAMVTPKVRLDLAVPLKPERPVNMDVRSVIIQANGVLVGVGEASGFEVFDARIP